MKKCINGRYIEMTEEEIAVITEQSKEMIYKERIRPRTITEGLLELNRSLVIDKVTTSDDKTIGIACMALFESWANGIFEVGDIRTNPITGYPYECILAHDSTVNKDWTIDVRTLWKPYHSRKKEYALPWEQPTGAHDMYKSGEYMIWTDKEIYLCVLDTNFSPSEYPQAWQIVE